MNIEKNSAYDLFIECTKKLTIKEIEKELNLHSGTIKRWLKLKKVPNKYFNDLNFLLNNKYPPMEEYRDKDQFYTSVHISEYCFNKAIEILKKFEINPDDYIFIEPSAGCCSFYNLLPQNRKIGIDIDPKGNKELIKKNYLDFLPLKNKKYIVIGNPPFGLRGNLALRFINHSYKFADVVAFILPPLFDSDGKGVPKKRIKGYKLAHSEKLPLNSFEYPNGKKIEIATIFQIWIKINTHLIKNKEKATCNGYIKVYSLSDGGTPGTTRNKNMLNKCDVYLPSTCFKDMRAYKNFEELPYRRGYGVVFLREKNELKKIFFNEIDWEKVSFLGTNSSLNLRTSLIENEVIKKGYKDIITKLF